MLRFSPFILGMADAVARRDEDHRRRDNVGKIACIVHRTAHKAMHRIAGPLDGTLDGGDYRLVEYDGWYIHHTGKDVADIFLCGDTCCDPS